MIVYKLTLEDRMIFEFMGLPNENNESGQPLKWSWNMLMPVVQAINATGKGCRFDILKGYATCSVEKTNKFHKDFSFASSVTFETQGPLEACLGLVIKFLKHYNETVHNTSSAAEVS